LYRVNGTRGQSNTPASQSLKKKYSRLAGETRAWSIELKDLFRRAGTIPLAIAEMEAY
jgi:hypothetical protein